MFPGKKRVRSTLRVKPSSFCGAKDLIKTVVEEGNNEGRYTAGKFSRRLFYAAPKRVILGATQRTYGNFTATAMGMENDQDKRSV